jgi:hypothetical protein
MNPTRAYILVRNCYENGKFTNSSNLSVCVGSFEDQRNIIAERLMRAAVVDMDVVGLVPFKVHQTLDMVKVGSKFIEAHSQIEPNKIFSYSIQMAPLAT